MQLYICLLFQCCILFGCAQPVEVSPEIPVAAAVSLGSIVNADGTTVQTRFNPPVGFFRKLTPGGSFAEYLRCLPLKPVGSKVKYFNGELKQKDVYSAVVDMEISNKDLQQCADAIIRLRGEYFYSIQAYDSISFKLTNGFETPYSKWINGNRVVVNGNNTTWSKSHEPANTYRDFRNYLEFVFTYAGTLSLANTLKPKNIQNLAIGDVFIVGGSPGHAVLVVDVAENNKGEKVFLLAQSYMPAQEIQILKNFNNEFLSPWYSADFENELSTPEWTFTTKQLKTW